MNKINEARQRANANAAKVQNSDLRSRSQKIMEELGVVCLNCPNFKRTVWEEERFTCEAAEQSRIVFIKRNLNSTVGVALLLDNVKTFRDNSYYDKNSRVNIAKLDQDNIPKNCPLLLQAVNTVLASPDATDFISTESAYIIDGVHN